MSPQTIFSIVPALVSVVTITLSYLYNRRVISQKNSEDEKKEIYKKLNEFFGPFLALRKKNKMLYDLFALKFKANNPEFRTLTHLLNGNVLEGNEKVLFDEIILNTEFLEKILLEKAGLVDSEELRDNYFPKFLAHCNIIKLAYRKQLVGENERFKENTFPKGIDECIELQFNNYKQRLKELNAVKFLF